MPHRHEVIPLPQPVKQKIRDGIVAVSVANFCFLHSGFDLLFENDRFFDKVPVTPPLLLALLVNILWVATVIWLGIQWWRRSPNRAVHLVLDLLLVLLVFLPVDFIRMKAMNVTDYQLYTFLKQPMVILCVIVATILVVWRHRRVAHAAAVAAGIVSPLAFFMLSKSLLVCVGIMHLHNCAEAVTLPPVRPVPAGQPRVLWIIFDEMDYRLVYEQRPDGVPLPALDQLRNESFFANEAYSPADGTIISMPSAIIGRRLSAVSYDNTCDLRVMFADTGATAQWSLLPSVFSEARSLGVNTAVVGWYIPYERMLPNALNYCAWWPYPSFEPTRAATFGAEMGQQIGSLFGTMHFRQMCINVYQDCFTTALTVVTNPAYGLTLLHLPPPHRPGVYLPDQKRFTVWPMSKVTGYLNNLRLADLELGAFRQAMEKSGDWDRTWVILSADHSWRESRLFDGKRDMRVPFLVKPPKGGEAMIYPQQFNTVLTHDLILAILRGEITNVEAVATWFDAHRLPTGNITAPAKLE